MDPHNPLNTYLKQLQARLRMGLIFRGLALLALVALASTLLVAFCASLFLFSGASLIGARIVLFVVMAGAVVYGLALPLYRLSQSRAAAEAERTFPRFEQRLVTFAERRPGGDNTGPARGQDAMFELLAAETSAMAAEAPVARVAPGKRLLAWAGLAAGSLAVLIWMIAAAPGFAGRAAAMVWTGSSRTAGPLYALRIAPGDASIRRNSDQMVTAQITGLQPKNVRIYAHFQSAAKWEQLPMEKTEASGYEFIFSGVPENIEYYVEAGPLRSPHFNLKVMDVAAVKQIKVTYHFPSWTGQPDSTVETGGDLHAVEGTDAKLEIATDKPLKDGALVLDDGRQIALSPASGDLYTATLHIDKDDNYHVAAASEGQQVRISDDFYIEARKTDPPTVQIVRPVGDYSANPIEEVTLSAKASDDFGLSGFALHYSVNGQEEKTVNLLTQKGIRVAGGTTTLYLEDFKLIPGDLVAYYATAQGAQGSSRTDLFFIQATAFEFQPADTQQVSAQGAAPGQQSDSAQISAREKQIIADTWKDQDDRTSAKDALAENARFLAGLQTTLRDEALSLVGRIEARQLAGENEDLKSFQKDMNSAAQAMSPAAQNLGQQKWGEAIASEEKSLQYLLRAQTTFQQIEAALINRGDSGKGSGDGRELSNLFQLELDAEKQQFEPNGAASAGNNPAQALDDAAQKADDLATKQGQLAADQGQGPQNDAQRKQQQTLLHSAEALEQQVQQLAQSENSQQAAAGQSASSGSSAGAGAGGNSPSTPSASGDGGQASAGDRMQPVLDSVRQAEQSMQRATSRPNSVEAHTAADQLRDAADLLGEMQEERSSQQLDSATQQLSQIADAMHAQNDQAGKLLGSGNAQQLQRLADERQDLAGKLEQVQKQLQQSQRELAKAQPDAAKKLLDALGAIQQGDLINRIKKSAEQIGQGKDPNAGGEDADISNYLKSASDRLQQAEQAVNSQGPNLQNLAKLERVRNQMATVIKSTEPNSKPPIFLSGEDETDPELAARERANQGPDLDALAGGQQGIVMGLGGQQGNSGPSSAKDLRGSKPGDGTDGKGNQQAGTERAPTTLSQADIDLAVKQAQEGLGALKQAAQGHPADLAAINDLINQMKRLDASSSPDPATLAKLEGQVIAMVDHLELQMRREAEEKQANQVRNSGMTQLPQGYQSAVEEYFRRLSQIQKQTQ